MNKRSQCWNKLTCTPISKFTGTNELKRKGNIEEGEHPFNGSLVAFVGLRPGGRFSKYPGTYRARKAILGIMIRLPWKAALLICFRYNERENNCQVSKLETCSYWRYKGIYVTRKVSGRSRNGPRVRSDHPQSPSLPSFWLFHLVWLLRDNPKRRLWRNLIPRAFPPEAILYMRFFSAITVTPWVKGCR